MKHYLILHLNSCTQALTRMLKQPFASLLTLLVLSIALALPLSLYLTVKAFDEWSGRISAHPQMTLFLELTAEPDEVSAIESSLKNNPHIGTYTFIPKLQALNELETRNNLSGLIEGLHGNPLPDSFIVTPNTFDPKVLERLKTELAGLPMVEHAQFDSAWTQRLFALIQLGNKIIFFLALALALALVVITHNTVRMQILARHEEIEVSYLIGAPNNFIRRPFLYHAFWQGILSALLAWGFSLWLLMTINPVLSDLAQLYNISFIVHGLSVNEVISILIASAILAMLGAKLATDHHLRALQHKSY